MNPEHSVRTDRDYRLAKLQAALSHAGHYLPAQAPLEVFVHHNTLHAFQHLPFHAALAEASRKLGARCYLPEEAYRAAFEKGRITEADVRAALTRMGPALEAQEQTQRAFENWPAQLPPLAELCLLIQLKGLRETSPAGLSWLITEMAADRRFRPDLPPAVRERFAKGVLGGVTGDGKRVREDAERAIISSLWKTCLAIAQGLEVRENPPPQTFRFPRDLLIAVGDEDPNDLVHPVLIPLCAAFLDRGQAHFTMPGRGEGFFAAWRHIALSGRVLRPAWERTLGKRIRQQPNISAEDAVLSLLDELGIPDNEYEGFVEHVLLQLPSWAGMFQRLEGSALQVGLSSESPKVTLMDFLAVRLSLDVLAYLDVGERLGHRGPLRDLLPFLRAAPKLAAPQQQDFCQKAWPLFNLAQLAGIEPAVLRSCSQEVLRTLFALMAEMNEGTRLCVWHEAFERHYRDEVLSALVANIKRGQTAQAARFQVICCIDDRAESFRRHLEENNADIETFGAAGFFNLAIAFQGIDDPSTFPLCPVVIKPQHRIAEEPAAQDAPLWAQRQRRLRRWHTLQAIFDRASRSLVLGSILTAMTGFVAAVPLLLTVFLPKFAARLRRLVIHTLLPQVRTQLSQRTDAGLRATATAGLYTGFSLEEKATRVAGLLENLGLVRDFASMVVVLGHDSSSVNNPHFAAYSCGACGGRSGGPNARLFARMANRKEVRALLRQKGIDIPAQTLFIGGVHDTAIDSIQLYEEAVPLERREEFLALQACLKAALLRNAHERTRRFASASPDFSLEQALAHVEERAADLGQARPELGHATNAACIVGRRRLSRDVFLDRRSFLVSYDPQADPSGTILERILLAVGPVCAGINLEYFFSTVDNERLGAGTKLPHNVTGLIAVMNGASSDLRTGLPKQMIEIHEPVRLQLILDASPETVLAIIKRQPSLAELIEKEWVQAITITPETDPVAVHVYQAESGFVRWIHSTRGFATHKAEQAAIAMEQSRNHPFLSGPEVLGIPQSGPTPVPHTRSSHDFYHGHDGFLPPALISRKADTRERL